MFPFSISARMQRWTNRLAKLLLLSLLLFLLYCLPILGYVDRVIGSVNEHGLSVKTVQEIRQHNQWFLYFFTGPPSDVEMIAFFKKHRKEMESLAYLYATEMCSVSYSENRDSPCEKVQDRLGLGHMSSFRHGLMNSIYALNISGPCGESCYAQDYTFGPTNQNWWRSTNPRIFSWYKAFVYIPPLIPAKELGLDPRHFPNDPDEVMNRVCEVPGHAFRQSLDQLIPEIENAELLPWNCVFRPIGDGWYIILRAGFEIS